MTPTEFKKLDKKTQNKYIKQELEMCKGLKLFDRINEAVLFCCTSRGETNLTILQCPTCLYTHVCPTRATRGLGLHLCCGNAHSWTYKSIQIAKDRLMSYRTGNKFHKIVVLNRNDISI